MLPKVEVISLAHRLGVPLETDLELPHGGKRALLEVRRVYREEEVVRRRRGSSTLCGKTRPKTYKTSLHRPDSCDGPRTTTEQVAKTQFIDVLADTQVEPAELVVDAGVADLKVLYQNGKIAMPVLLTIQTSTGLHRGVHMSRLVHAASAKQGSSIESWLKAICAEVNKTQPGARAVCTFEIPYADQFIPVVVKTSEKGAIRYQFTAKGMTACPCSKRMIGIGHMQRAEITMVLEKRTALDSTATIEKMGECFSAVPTETHEEGGGGEEDTRSPGERQVRRGPGEGVRQALPERAIRQVEVPRVDTRARRVATWSKNSRSAPL